MACRFSYRLSLTAVAPSARPRVVQVDGLLLLHLMNEDWGHLGINSPLTVRRIDVAMQEYRLRFERKQVGRPAAPCAIESSSRTSLIGLDGSRSRCENFIRNR